MMRRSPSPKSFVLIALVSIVVGAALLAFGLRMPIYTDASAAESLFGNWCGPDGRTNPSVEDAYFALFSSHYTLIDTGRGLIGCGLTIMGLVLTLRQTAAHPEGWLRTPSRLWAFFALGIAISLAWWVAAEQFFVVVAKRQMLPACGDSIGIPMMGLAIAFIPALAFCLLAGFLISRQFGSLPAPLLGWDRQHPWRSWLATLFLGGLALFLLEDAVVGIFSPTWPMTCPAILALYLIESTRSALLTPKRLSSAPTGPSAD